MKKQAHDALREIGRILRDVEWPQDRSELYAAACYARSMNYGRFKYVWKLVCRTYQKEPHCFKHGCGRWTLSMWVWKVTRQKLQPSEIRAVLNHACKKGWAKSGKSRTGHTTFILNA